MLRQFANRLTSFIRKKDVPNTDQEHLFKDCLVCKKPMSDAKDFLQYRVCPHCHHHYVLTAREQIDVLVDGGSFKESLDHRFFGGTIGTISGEKMALAFENATRKKLPILALLSTGQSENRGLMQLMQIPKILIALSNFKENTTLEALS